MLSKKISAEELLDWLRKHGVETESSDFYDGYDRIVLSKDGEVFPFVYMQNYPERYILKLCEQLKIPFPD
jgi:hypothetical protein